MTRVDTDYSFKDYYTKRFPIGCECNNNSITMDMGQRQYGSARANFAPSFCLDFYFAVRVVRLPSFTA
jgi:hypothetical protein